MLLFTQFTFTFAPELFPFSRQITFEHRIEFEEIRYHVKQFDVFDF